MHLLQSSHKSCEVLSSSNSKYFTHNTYIPYYNLIQQQILPSGGYHCVSDILVIPPTKFVGGVTGFTLSVCLSVRLSVDETISDQYLFVSLCQSSSTCNAMFIAIIQRRSSTTNIIRPITLNNTFCVLRYLIFKNI